MTVAGPARGRVLMVVENQGLPGDRRVLSEARTLAADGWEVVVVCPEGDEPRPQVELVEGIEVHRFRLRPAGSAAGYLREYSQALVRIRRLVRALARRRRFDVVHTANPPDFLHAALRAPRAQGARFIFDHHDLAPELYLSRYGRAGLAYRALAALERRGLQSADVVIATNESYRRIAIQRGGVPPENVFVVRNGPDHERFTPVPPDPALRRGRRHLLAYLGAMGPQDGIDHALHALAALRARRGEDWRAVFMGAGEVLDRMRALAGDLELGDTVEFAGWCDDDDIRRTLSTADVCLAPDPPGPLNDISTMIKVPEYMAMGCAIASYRLRETVVSAGDAAVYAALPEPESLATCIDELLDDPGRREAMGRLGLERARRLSWEHSAEALRAAYARALRDRQVAGGSRGALAPHWSPAEAGADSVGSPPSGVSHPTS